ncbi:24853_t:CDS:1, partial [Dentiscutata erythropus]
MGSQRDLARPSNTSDNTSNSDVCQPMEDKETDDFLDEAYKKSVSDGIMKHNKEKKLRELSSQDVSFQDKKSQLHKKVAENIVKDVFDFTATSTSEKNHATEILLTPVSENHVTENN